MRAWRMDSYDGVDGLRLDESFPDPVPGRGEVIVRVTLSALNPADEYLSRRLYPARPELPHILGRDGLGFVESCGPGSTRFPVGAKVVFLRGDAGISRRGTLAQLAVAREEWLATPPPDWTDEEACGAALVYQTAHQCLNQWGALAPGSNVLVTGVSGGVGLAAAHLAKAMGHRVIGLSRTRGKWDALRAHGVDVVLDPGDEKLRDAIKAAAGPGGVALAIDLIGGTLLPTILDTMAMRGNVSVAGALAGPVPGFNGAKLFFKRLRLGGIDVSSYTDAEARAAWREIVDLLNQSGRRPAVDSTFAFENAKAAFARLKEGPMGKVVVRV